MNFGNFGFTEILMLLVLVLLLFGAKRLPEIGASMGKGIKEFKRSISDTQKALTDPEPPARTDRVAAGEQEPVVRRDEDRPEPKRLLG